MTAPQDPLPRPDADPDGSPQAGGPRAGAPGDPPPYTAPGYGMPQAYGVPQGYDDPVGPGRDAGAPGGDPGYSAPSFGTPPPGYGQPSFGPGSGTQLYPGGPQLAEWSTRAGGYLVDFGISFVAQFVAALIDPVLAQVVGFGIFLYFGYVTGTTGQTPGRKVVGIRVLREADGQVLGPGAGIGRGFLHILDALPLLLGFFWPLWDKKKQTFADKLIHSVVVKV